MVGKEPQKKRVVSVLARQNKYLAKEANPHSEEVKHVKHISV